VVSDDRVLYPYISHPGIVMALSQEAYDKYYGELPKGGALIVEEDLVKLSSDHPDLKLWRVPATRFAEEVGNRLFTNLVALGFFTAVTGVVTADAMKKALPGLVPDRFLKVNIKAFEKGYEYGVEAVKAGGAKS
jgi:2-oxoglutarate ferredoxin oxidoreductase subunit gamma